MYAVLNRRALLPVMLRNGGKTSQTRGMMRFYVCLYSRMMGLHVCLYCMCVHVVFTLHECDRMCVYMSLVCDMTCLCLEEELSDAGDDSWMCV